VLGPLIFLADYKGFAPEDDDPALRPANEAAFQRLIDSYRPLGFYGEGMGYGQGFVTQAALLLDRMNDVTPMLDWAAKEINDPRIGSFIVPEGVVIDPTRKYWFRTGDLGNGVQEAEIVKALRIVIGVDDTQPQRLRIFPRMPYGWDEIAVEKYPVLFEREGKTATALVHYKLERTATRMNLNSSSDKALGAVTVRVGPFAHQPNASSVRFNRKLPAGASIQHSGDSWWVRFTTAIGPSSGITQQWRSHDERKNPYVARLVLHWNIADGVWIHHLDHGGGGFFTADHSRAGAISSRALRRNPPFVDRRFLYILVLARAS
jgi:hypothetical protein